VPVSFARGICVHHYNAYALKRRKLLGQVSAPERKFSLWMRLRDYLREAYCPRLQLHWQFGPGRERGNHEIYPMLAEPSDAAADPPSNATMKGRVRT